MTVLDHPTQLILGLLSVFSAMGIIVLKKPVHACLSFLLTLLSLAALYLQLSAPFIAVMQVLVYAGAILVIFMFVIVLFQDAYLQIAEFKAESFSLLLISAGSLFLLTALLLGSRLGRLPFSNVSIPASYGSVQALGEALYTSENQLNFLSE
jgi:NADH-quinone oxidoreductase subunit J